jgi:hypothetical protein
MQSSVLLQTKQDIDFALAMEKRRIYLNQRLTMCITMTSLEWPRETQLTDWSGHHSYFCVWPENMWRFH